MNIRVELTLDERKFLSDKLESAELFNNHIIQSHEKTNYYPENFKKAKKENLMISQLMCKMYQKT